MSFLCEELGTMTDHVSRSELVFGDQEEIGLGVRLAAPLTEKNGGVIANSAGGARGAKAVWGQSADWCDYSGTLGKLHAGILLMPDPGNFRPSWFHSREYGPMAANPFGRNAFTKGEKSVVTVKPGESFLLRFGVLLHAAPAGQEPDLAAKYQHFKDTLVGSQ